MKIAIKANPDRGKEIISLLKSLGGINEKDWKGDGRIDTYYIDKDNKIQYDRAPKDYKVYTLEEFEKEFPFKIGDKVTIISGFPYKIIALEYYMGRLCYKLDNGLNYNSKELTLYKEMKEERNITLTLDKAKEWYKKGGELKEIALQAFTEKELTKVDLPKTWEEFCENYPIKDGMSYICTSSNIKVMGPYDNDRFRSKIEDKNLCPSKESAEAHLAMIQLEQLRDCWRQGWKPTKYDAGYQIIHYNEKYSIRSFCFISFLSFPTKEMAEEFLECFRDLIEQAGDLI